MENCFGLVAVKSDSEWATDFYWESFAEEEVLVGENPGRLSLITEFGSKNMGMLKLCN